MCELCTLRKPYSKGLFVYIYFNADLLYVKFETGFSSEISLKLGQKCTHTRTHTHTHHHHHHWRSLWVEYDCPPSWSLWVFRWAKRPILDQHTSVQCRQGWAVGLGGIILMEAHSFLHLRLFSAALWRLSLYRAASS